MINNRNIFTTRRYKLIGTCILAMVFSPIFAEFLAYFNHDCRGFLRSDKIMTIGSFEMEPRTFRAIAFIIIFMIIYPLLRWMAGGGLSWHSDMSFVVSYMCFLALIEPLIIYINKDEEAEIKPKEPFPDWFSMKTRLIMMGAVVIIGACADPFIWSTCLQGPLDRDPNAYAEIVKNIPQGMKKQALWFLNN